MQTPSEITLTTLSQLIQSVEFHPNSINLRQSHVLIWVTRGQGRALLHGVHRGFGAHNIVFAPAQTLLSLDLGRQILGQALILPHMEHDHWPEQPLLFRVQDIRHQAELTGLLDIMRREIEGQQPMMAQALVAQAALVSIWLQRQMLIRPKPGRTTASERLMRRFCDAIGQHLGNGWNAGDFAEHLDITATHLARVCKQATGMTAADFLTQCILCRAREEICMTPHPFKEIAQTLGFNSAAYFTRFVQQHTQKTPRELRQSYKAQPSGIAL